jgi:hypothetical protein
MIIPIHASAAMTVVVIRPDLSIVPADLRSLQLWPFFITPDSFAFSLLSVMPDLIRHPATFFGDWIPAQSRTLSGPECQLHQYSFKGGI